MLHGQEGDRCWDDKYCHNRRSFYRKLARTSNEKNTINTVVLKPQENYFAILLLYRDSGERPLHALGAELWLGQAPTFRLQSVHCFGLTAGAIREYTQQVLEAFSLASGINLNKYKDIFEISPERCPVRPCPLHPDD
ncbi:hypothetical protein CAL7716_104470 (plasmid) [Calothrix sp. PCC 7716]|nr:hypothetical protein CAL7716_104470 [Calothrix sp. PCC 7716]